MFNSDYSIKGKHADFMRMLVKSSEGLSIGKSAKIFEYGYQVLFIAPLIGASYDLKPEVDQTENMDFTIKAIQMIKYKENFEKVYNMVLLADRSLKINPDERVNFVFRQKQNEKEIAKELFDSYARGGIEWLYENIVENGNSSDNYLNNIISAIDDFTREFAIYKDIESKVKETEELYI